LTIEPLHNKTLEVLFSSQCYVLKKKALYLEKIFCGVIALDNTFKLYPWYEKTVDQGVRILKWK